MKPKVLYIIITSLFLTLCYNSMAQYPKKDTIRYNQFKDYVEWSKRHHKQKLEDIENEEKYQIIYFDKVIIDKKNHKIYLYSSYDLSNGEELGLGFNIGLSKRKKKIK